MAVYVYVTVRLILHPIVLLGLRRCEKIRGGGAARGISPKLQNADFENVWFISQFNLSILHGFQSLSLSLEEVAALQFFRHPPVRSVSLEIFSHLLILYVIGAFLWLIALSKTTLNFAYPFTALTFVLVISSSRVVFLESIPTLRYFGIGLICLGILLSSLAEG